MILTPPVLAAAFKSFSTLFQEAYAGASSNRRRVAMEVPSGARSNVYAWLQSLPGLREWVGDRVIHDFAAKGYEITNKKFEETVSVKRDDFEDDQLGVYAPLFRALGMDAAQHPDILVFEALKNGFAQECFDGKSFFDTDHIVGGSSVSNCDEGSGAPWYLLCTTRPVKPLIFQMRRVPQLTRMDQDTDEANFMRSEYRYGVDYRGAVGYGLWQTAYGSKLSLNAANYAAARAAMMAFKSESGAPLGIVPDLLVVPPTLESAGRGVVAVANEAGGATNPWFGTAELLVVPWLA